MIKVLGGEMNISIFGMGYVGCVTSACLAKNGHEVIGCDTNQVKVDLINEGKSPIIEKDIEEIIRSTVSNGSFQATNSCAEAISQTSAAFICVGTPSNPNGSFGLDYVLRVAQNIGNELKKKSEYFVVIIKSTVLPGTTNDQIIPALEKASEKKVGIDIGVCMNPEFLREGSSVHDFYYPPKKCYW